MKIRTTDILIILLAGATAAIHLYLNVLMGKWDVLFTLNAIGFIGLTVALYLPLPILKNYPTLVRITLMAYTLLTIMLWVFLGRPYTTIGYIDKVIEAALFSLLLFKRP